MSENRVRKGVPSGGQFAEQARGEATEVDLGTSQAAGTGLTMVRVERIGGGSAPDLSGMRVFPGVRDGVPITEGHFVMIERDHGPDLLVGPYPNEAMAEWALQDSPLVDGECQEDCLDAYVHTGSVPDDAEVAIPDAVDELAPMLAQETSNVSVEIGDIVVTRADNTAKPAGWQSWYGEVPDVRFEVQRPDGVTSVHYAHSVVTGAEKIRRAGVEEVAERTAGEALALADPAASWRAPRDLGNGQRPGDLIPSLDGGTAPAERMPASCTQCGTRGSIGVGGLCVRCAYAEAQRDIGPDW